MHAILYATNQLHAEFRPDASVVAKTKTMHAEGAAPIRDTNIWAIFIALRQHTLR